MKYRIIYLVQQESQSVEDLNNKNKAEEEQGKPGFLEGDFGKFIKARIDNLQGFVGKNLWNEHLKNLDLKSNSAAAGSAILGMFLTKNIFLSALLGFGGKFGAKSFFGDNKWTLADLYALLNRENIQANSSMSGRTDRSDIYLDPGAEPVKTDIELNMKTPTLSDLESIKSKAIEINKDDSNKPYIAIDIELMTQQDWENVSRYNFRGSREENISPVRVDVKWPRIHGMLDVHGKTTINFTPFGSKWFGDRTGELMNFITGDKADKRSVSSFNKGFNITSVRTRLLQLAADTNNDGVYQNTGENGLFGAIFRPNHSNAGGYKIKWDQLANQPAIYAHLMYNPGYSQSQEEVEEMMGLAPDKAVLEALENLNHKVNHNYEKKGETGIMDGVGATAQLILSEAVYRGLKLSNINSNIAGVGKIVLEGGKFVFQKVIPAGHKVGSVSSKILSVPLKIVTPNIVGKGLDMTLHTAGAPFWLLRYINNWNNIQNISIKIGNQKTFLQLMTSKTGKHFFQYVDPVSGLVTNSSVVNLSKGLTDDVIIKAFKSSSELQKAIPGLANKTVKVIDKTEIDMFVWKKMILEGWHKISGLGNKIGSAIPDKIKTPALRAMASQSAKAKAAATVAGNFLKGANVASWGLLAGQVMRAKIAQTQRIESNQYIEKAVRDIDSIIMK